MFWKRLIHKFAELPLGRPRSRRCFHHGCVRNSTVEVFEVRHPPSGDVLNITLITECSATLIQVFGSNIWLNSGYISSDPTNGTVYWDTVSGTATYQTDDINGGVDSFEVSGTWTTWDIDVMTALPIQIDHSATVTVNIAIPPQYRLTVCVDQPGSGGDRDPYEMTWNPITNEFDYSVGHAFLELTTPSGESHSYGLYPAAPPSDWTAWVLGSGAGVIQDDSAHPSDVSHTWRISYADYGYLHSVIEAEKNAPPNWGLSSYNCASWVLDKIALVGIVIPQQPAPVTNPGGLGEDLRQLSQ